MAAFPNRNAAAAPPIPNASSWFQEWSARTPVVCRCAIFTILFATTISYLSGLPLLLVPYVAINSLQLWTFFTSIIVQGDVLGLIFVCIVYAISSPPWELKRGSLSFLWHVVSSALILNVIYVPVALLLSIIPIRGFERFGLIPATGAWPALIMLMAENALADPTGSTKLLCYDVPNKVYGWVIATGFSLMSFFPMVDIFLAVALAHAREYIIIISSR